MPKIKICGLFRELDIEFANEAKPDFIGFVFAEKSKRYVTAKQAESLRKNLAKEIIPVGVFVNAKIEEIVGLQKNGIIDIIQLHGNEPDAYIAELKQNCDAPIIRAIHSPLSIVHSPLSNYILIDSPTPGGGQTFDWGLLQNLDLSQNVFLAGGINLQNISEALKLNPYAIDISSGAETDGVKDRDKMLRLVAYTRGSGKSEIKG